MSAGAVTVAVVGAGPAGVACAARLLAVGVDVRVYDANGVSSLPFVPAAGKNDVKLSVAMEIYGRGVRAVESSGAIERANVAAVRWNRGGHVLTLADGKVVDAECVVLATGADFPAGWSPDHACLRVSASRLMDEALECGPDGLVDVVGGMRTAQMGCYAVGSLVAGYVPTLSSATGTGDMAARDILASLAA